jgi:hypothetical protein
LTVTVIGTPSPFEVPVAAPEIAIVLAAVPVGSATHIAMSAETVPEVTVNLIAPGAVAKPINET